MVFGQRRSSAHGGFRGHCRRAEVSGLRWLSGIAGSNAGNPAKHFPAQPRRPQPCLCIAIAQLAPGSITPTIQRVRSHADCVPSSSRNHNDRAIKHHLFGISQCWPNPLPSGKFLRWWLVDRANRILVRQLRIPNRPILWNTFLPPRNTKDRRKMHHIAFVLDDGRGGGARFLPFCC